MGQFYQTGTFWVSVAGVLISLLVGLLAAVIALKSAPKRRLFYGISDPVPLMTSDGAKHGLEVRRDGQKLIDPRMLDLTLHSNGRQSITSEMYDQGRSLAVHLDVPIVAILKVATEPSEQAVPKYEIFDSTLKIGPDVLAARQRIIFSLLVDGQPSLQMESHLSDVSIRRQQSGPEQIVRRISYVALGAAVVAAVTFFSYAQLAAKTVAQSPSTVPASAQELNIPGILPPFGNVQKIAYNMMPSFGFNPKQQYRCLGYLWENVSGWNYKAENAIGAYGIPQAFPGSKMGGDWQTNPIQQIKWGLIYIQSVYKTPCDAWNFERTHGYY